jgi:hypothetical protein
MIYFFAKTIENLCKIYTLSDCNIGNITKLRIIFINLEQI